MCGWVGLGKTPPKMLLKLFLRVFSMCLSVLPDIQKGQHDHTQNSQYDHTQKGQYDHIQNGQYDHIQNGQYKAQSLCSLDIRERKHTSLPHLSNKSIAGTYMKQNKLYKEK